MTNFQSLCQVDKNEGTSVLSNAAQFISDKVRMTILNVAEDALMPKVCLFFVKFNVINGECARFTKVLKYVEVYPLFNIANVSIGCVTKHLPFHIILGLSIGCLLIGMFDLSNFYSSIGLF